MKTAVATTSFLNAKLAKGLTEKTLYNYRLRLERFSATFQTLPSGPRAVEVYLADIEGLLPKEAVQRIGPEREHHAVLDAAGTSASTALPLCAAEIVCPLIHERPPPLEQVRAEVRGFGRVPNYVC